MLLNSAIVIGGVAVNVMHHADAYVAMTYSPGMRAMLIDEEGKVVAESYDPDVVYAWPTQDDRPCLHV